MKTPALKLGTWNVRTMTPGFSDNLQDVNAARKTAVIDRELSRLQMDIVALQETRLPETGISIKKHELDVIHDFVYLGSAISDTLSLDAELNRRIGKAATTMTRLTKKAWNNSKLTVHTKIQIYRACVVSTLLYGSESWTLRARQERKLNAFHMRSLRRILNITWQDKVPNNTVLERAGCTSMFTLLKQRCMRWLGHVVRMDDGRVPKDLYGEPV